MRVRAFSVIIASAALASCIDLGGRRSRGGDEEGSTGGPGGAGTGDARPPKPVPSPTTVAVDPARPFPYPVDPRAHLTDKGLDPLSPGSIRASVPNARAYARYALFLAPETGAGEGAGVLPSTDDEVALLSLLGRIASAAPIAPTGALELYALSLADAERDAYSARLMEGRAEVSVPGTSASRVALMRKQVDACSSRGVAVIDCCRSLMAPAFLIEEWSKLAPAGRTLATSTAAQAAAGEFVARYVAASSAADASAEGTVFRLQGVKAWLAACSTAVGGLPRDLASLRASVGDYHAAKPGDDVGEWTVELHPVSRAKFAGRRIYRKKAGGVSVAESLAEDCSVKETEVIWDSAGGESRFASYSAIPERGSVEYGWFPVKLGREVVKFTPDSCMGCHYTFDTRRFAVRIPSHRALNLRVQVIDGIPQARDDARCGRPGERIVTHAD